MDDKIRDKVSTCGENESL